MMMTLLDQSLCRYSLLCPPRRCCLLSGAVLRGAAAPIEKSTPRAPQCSVKWLHCAMFVLYSSLVFVLHFLMLILNLTLF